MQPALRRYVHTYTRQLSAARPQGAGPYKEDAPADPEKAARDKRRKEVEEMRKSFPTFELQDVHAAARDVIAGKKTPLVLCVPAPVLSEPAPAPMPAPA